MIEKKKTKQKPRPRVTMEPELEFILREHTLWERLETAERFERWARQIRVSLCILNGYPPYKKTRGIFPPEPRRGTKVHLN